MVPCDCNDMPQAESAGTGLAAEPFNSAFNVDRERTLVNSPVQARPARPALDPATVRGDFPMLGATVNRKRLVYRVAPIDDAGDINLAGLRERLSSRTRVVAISHVSHVLGTASPVREICVMAKA